MISILWATPNIDKTICYAARISNTESRDKNEYEKLIGYLLREGHFSPFEMANVCIEVNTTRDIGRQILRHRSFSFQEFSQRYSDVFNLEESSNYVVNRECRKQDTKNRQNSFRLPDNHPSTEQFNKITKHVYSTCMALYEELLSLGVAKECARSILPEGLTPTRIAMNGTMRSWIFFLKQRLHKSAQYEIRVIAYKILTELKKIAPLTIGAAENNVFSEWRF